MTAPVAPPATSVAVTAAQAATYLNPDTADTGSLYIYHEAAVPASPGYLTSDLETLLRVAPQTSTAKNIADLVTALASNDTKLVYAFLEPSVATGLGFTVADFVTALNQAFPQYGTTAVHTVKPVSKSAVYTTIGVIPVPEVFFTDGTTLIISAQAYVDKAGLFFKVLGGSYNGKYIRSEDVIPVVR